MKKNEILKHFKNAVLHEKNGNYNEAMALYLFVLKNDKQYRDAYVNLGSLYSRMNRLADAIKCYHKALSLAEDSMTYFNLGCVHYKMNDYKKAVICLEKSRVINKKFYIPSLVIGLCYSRLKNFRAAEVNFLEVLKLNPGQRVATTALALLYYNEKRYTESIALLDTLTGKDPVNVTLREVKSDILYETGRIDESVQEIKSIKKISNRYALYDQFISSIPVDAFTDKYGTLEEKIKELSEKPGSDSHNLMSLSLCYLFKGDTDKAIDYLFKAKKVISE